MNYGYFDNEKCEYVITRVDTPSSWTNYLGTENLVGVFNQTAGGYLFYRSAEHHRLTRFRANAVPLDRPGHYVYLRDDETGDFWSLSWQPVAKPPEHYRTRHGLSYSVYECEYAGIRSALTLFIPRGADAELWDITLENKSGRPRRLSLFTYAELSYHRIDRDNKNFQTTLYCAGADYADGVIEQQLHYDAGVFQFFTADFEPDGYETCREAFTGVWGTEGAPEALTKDTLHGSTLIGGNQCASLHKRFVLETGGAGGTVRCCAMLGVGNREAGLRVRSRFTAPEARDRAFAELAAYWEEKRLSLQVETPNENMNTMLNVWTFYQSEINVMFSRFASFIEVGGRTGIGYRDTAQDAMCAASSNPSKCRSRLIELLVALVSEGYGLHLFEAPVLDGEGGLSGEFRPPIHSVDDACSDDALWLVAAVTAYIRETGDLGFAGLSLPYADKPDLLESVYDHLKRILAFSRRMTGTHGICRGLKADWNDCLNLGGGESAMVSYLYLWALEHIIGLAGRLGKPDDEAEYRAHHREAAGICEKTLWDGAWYLRGFTKTGRPIGTDADKEGKVHLESNVWAVIAGTDSAERKKQAMDSVQRYLGTPYGLMLNAPAYTTVDDDVGFVTRVYPGLKENGAIFSHPNPWAWAAECMLGRGGRAMELYDALCPAAYNDRAELRKAEPYSTCQFITGKDHPAFGEGHHPFMTGSGGWSYFAATQFILGLRPAFDGLLLDPCIPESWEGFSVTRRFRGAYYHITVRNPAHVSKGVVSVIIDEKPLTMGTAALLPVLPAGGHYQIEAVMGRLIA